MEKNMALLLQYDGSRYDGWQRQGNTGNTIQGKLESVLEKMTGRYQEIHGSGRTDAGVHATGQVANVHLDTEMGDGEVRDYLNRYLPEDILVLEAKQVPKRFHSRLLARGKTYTYWVETGQRCPVFQRKYIDVLGQSLDVAAMEEAASSLVGTHDFTSFCTAQGKKKSAVRTLQEIRIVRHSSQLEFVLSGDGFLYNMVRILVGTLVEVGQGKRAAGSVASVMEARNRQEAGYTAPAKGLFLTRVAYDTEIF